MPAPTPLAALPAPAFDRPVALPLTAPLAARLDAILIAIPVVLALGPDPRVEALEAALGLAGGGLVTRQVRLADGRRPTLVAVPAALWIAPAGKAAVIALKRAAHALGRRLLLVPEGALDRDPALPDALLVAACAGVAVAPRDRLVLMSALVEAGGTMPLADAAEMMTNADDPVAAVLALVAGRVIGLDLGEPLGPHSRVLSLAGRLWLLRHRVPGGIA